MLRHRPYTSAFRREVDDLIRADERPARPRDFAAEQAAELAWRGQPEWVIRQEMERRLKVYARRRRVRSFKRWLQAIGGKRMGNLDSAKKSHGGRHARAVEAAEAGILSVKTEQERLENTIRATVKNLEEMLESGCTTEDFVDALDHLQQHRDALLKAIKHGA